MTTDQIERMIEEHNRQIADHVREMAEIRALFARNAESQRMTDEQIRATDAKLDRLIGKWGMFVESVVSPGVIPAFRKHGIELREIYRRVEASMDGKEMEIDILAVDGVHVVLVEVKSTLSEDDVREHLERLRDFKEFFPLYAGHRALGAVAGAVIPPDVAKFAYRKGFFVLGQSGETVAILNGPNFKPREW